MKTINFLTSHFIPENTACTNRVLAFVRELEKTYRVNVICLTQKGEKQSEERVIYSDRITLYYVNQKDFNGRNFIGRAFKEIFYIYQLVKRARHIEADLVIATSPYMFMIPLVGFGMRSPKILDIRDLVWEYLDDTSLLKRTIKRLLKVVMKRSMHTFDTIIVTNYYEERVLLERYGIEEVKVLFNGIEVERYEKLIAIEHTPKSPFTVTYVGNIGLAQNIYTLIEAAKRLPEVEFLILGTGIELDAIRLYITKHQITNVILTGKVAWYKLHSYYEKSDLLYAQLDKHYISAVPSKLYEYASIGLPIIYGGVGEAVKFVQTLEHATVVSPDNVEELVSAIVSMQEQEITLSQKNRLLIKEKYLRETAAKGIVKIVNTQLNTKVEV